MRKFFDPGVMEDDYKFSESGLYYAPEEGSVEVSPSFCVFPVPPPQMICGGERHSLPTPGQAYDPHVPLFSLLQGVREYVRSLPIEDSPDTFGLHSNADITFQQKETNNLLDTIILVAGGGGGGSGGGGGNGDQQVNEMAKNITERMPDAFDNRKAHPDSFKKVRAAEVVVVEEEEGEEGQGYYIGSGFVCDSPFLLPLRVHHYRRSLLTDWAMG